MTIASRVIPLNLLNILDMANIDSMSLRSNEVTTFVGPSLPIKKNRLDLEYGQVRNRIDNM